MLKKTCVGRLPEMSYAMIFMVQLYASDASIYEVRPLGVVRPRNVDDVVATVHYAAEHGISLHPRGSGSGLAGESLGRGLIVDFSCYFRRILATEETCVRVQAGVVLNRLNAHLAKQNRLFGPDPVNEPCDHHGKCRGLGCRRQSVAPLWIRPRSSVVNASGFS